MGRWLSADGETKGRTQLEGEKVEFPATEYRGRSSVCASTKSNKKQVVLSCQRVSPVAFQSAFRGVRTPRSALVGYLYGISQESLEYVRADGSAEV